MSMQAPEGSPELELGELVAVVGRPQDRVAPWRHVVNTGCAFGQAFAARPGEPLSGGPVKKCRHWAASFDIAALEVHCGHPRAMLPCTRSHVPAFGKVHTAAGKADATKVGGIVPKAMAGVYARCLQKALDGRAPPSKPKPSPPVRASPVGTMRCTEPAPDRHFVLVAGKPQALDEDAYGEVLEGTSETPRTRQRREKELAKDAAVADEHWRALAAQKDWDQVRTDLSVYAYSGEKITEDPRRTDAYKERVVDELGFGSTAAEKRPDLSVEEVAAAREVLSRKASAFWVAGRCGLSSTTPCQWAHPCACRRTTSAERRQRGLTRNLKKKSNEVNLNEASALGAALRSRPRRWRSTRGPGSGGWWWTTAA